MIDPAPSDTAWRLSRRPTAWLGHALSGAAGTLIGIGVLFLAVRFLPDAGGTAWLSAAIAGALALNGFVLVSILPAPARPAATAATAIGLAGAAGFLIVPHVDRLDDLRPLWAILIVAFMLCYFVGRLRLRSLFLALALIVAWTWILAEVASVETASFVSSEIPGSPQLDGAGPARSADETRDPNWGDLGLASALYGLTCLGAVILLDQRARYGVPPALTPIGVVAVSTGVILLGVGSGRPIVGGALAVLAGVFVGTAGAWAHRRFTVWSGALMVTVGATVIAVDLSDGGTSVGDSSVVTFGLVMIAFGLVLGVLAIVLARMMGEPAEEPPVAQFLAPPVASAAVDPPLEPQAAGTPDDTVWAPLESTDPGWPTG